MPKIVDSNTVTWSESSNELSATVGGDVVVDSVVIDDGGTIGSASDTDAITIDSSGRVGIGTSSPTAPLAFGKSVYGDPTSEDFYRIKFQDSGGIANDVGIGQPAASSMAFNFGPSLAYIAFRAGTAGEKMRIDSSGNVGIGTSSPGAELDVDGDIIADGVYLGGTAAANLLDDYEEGTWTPTLNGSTSDPTQSYQSGTYGKYTKVGRSVTCDFQITMAASGISAGSGNALVGGIPFSIPNPDRSSGVLMYTANWGTANTGAPIGLFADPGSPNQFVLYVIQNYPGSKSSAGAGIASAADITNFTIVTGSITYRVS